MEKIKTTIRGAFSLEVNSDFLLIDEGDSRIIYSSMFDVSTKINKVNSDIMAREKMGLLVQKSMYGRENSYEFPELKNRKVLVRKQYKDKKREHLVICSTDEEVFFYDYSMDYLTQLKAFFAIKHRLLIPEMFLEEISDKFTRECSVAGHSKNNLRARIVKVHKVKYEYFKNDVNWLSGINTSIDFIKENADEFRETLRKNVKVLYKEHHHYNIKKYRVVPFEGQEVLWGAGMEVLKNDDFLYIAADMGLGKTISSLIINHETQTEHRKKKFYTTLIVAPTSTMRGKDGGWTKEIQDVMTMADGDVIPHEIITITSEEGYKTFIKKISEINFKKIKKNYFFIISKEALKLSYKKIPQYQIKGYSFDKIIGMPISHGKKPVCPKCGGVLISEKGEHLIQDDFARIKDGKLDIKNRINENKKCKNIIKKWDDKKKEYKRVMCEGETYGLTVVNKEAEKTFDSEFEEDLYNRKMKKTIDELKKEGQLPTRKVSIIDYMKLRKIMFDGIIIDEVHEGNKPDSLIGRAQAVALKHGKKKIVLSGTSNAGYASNMFNIIRATMPSKLKAKGIIKSITEFSKKYGIFEKKISEKNNVKTGKTETKVEMKEREGISSTIFVDFLAENYIFFTFKDIKKIMQPLNEEYIKVEQNGYVSELVGEFTEKIDAINPRKTGMMKESIFRHMVNHPSEAWGGEVEVTPPNGETKMVPIPYFEDEFSFETHPLRLTKKTPKDDIVLKLVEKEMKEKRKVCIFTYFTGKGSSYMKGTKIQHRITELLETEGYRVAKLTADYLEITGKKKIKTKIDERATKLFELQNDFDILVTNPKIVNVGINLRFIPTYINYMPTYLVSEISQANRRGYRINTTVENRVFHLYYENTVEKEIIERFQTKRLEAKAMEGVFDVNIENEKEDKLRTHSKTVSTLIEKLDKNITIN